MSARNSALSASSRSAISASMAAHRHHGRVRLGGVGPHGVEVRVVLEAVVLDVGHIHRRLGGDQAQRLEQRPFLVGQAQRAHGLGLVEHLLRLFQHGNQLGGFLVIARLGGLGVALQGLFDRTQVSEGQFGVDDFDIGDGVDLARHVHDVLVFKAAHDVRDGVGFADVGEELVAQAFALGCARHQARDVDELDDCRQHALRLDDLGQRLQAGVRYFHHAHVGFDRAERVVLGGDAGFGQGIEQGRLADVGQTDDAALEAHGEKGSKSRGCVTLGEAPAQRNRGCARRSRKGVIVTGPAPVRPP